jgi:hypothetical protein
LTARRPLLGGLHDEGLDLCGDDPGGLQVDDHVCGQDLDQGIGARCGRLDNEHFYCGLDDQGIGARCGRLDNEHFYCGLDDRRYALFGQQFRYPGFDDLSHG